MEWLNEHVHIATWLALPIAIILAVIKNRYIKFAEIDWSRLLIYLAFLTCLAVIFTPAFDETSRTFAKGFIYFLIGWLMMDIRRRAVPDDKGDRVLAGPT